VAQGVYRPTLVQRGSGGGDRRGDAGRLTRDVSVHRARCQQLLRHSGDKHCAASDGVATDAPVVRNRGSGPLWTTSVDAIDADAKNQRTRQTLM
jgi:hypothetical protein